MPLDLTGPDQTVVATLNYLLPTAQKPVRWNVTPPPGIPVWNGADDPREVVIHDARPYSDSFSLDTSGFAFVAAPTRMADFTDPAVVRDAYYAEVENLLRQHLGAARVVVFDHNVRNAAHAGAGDPAYRPPVRRVHNDYTYVSSPQRVRDLLGAEAESLLRHRFAVVNVWRPLRGPVFDAPLALCDARSFTDDDLVPTGLVHADRVGETYSVVYRPPHLWYYLSGMRTDEVVLIKGYDSATDGRARLSFHSAFDNPLAPPDAPPRESIEVRALVFFPPDA